jgi:hypothetical protein
MRDRQHSYVSFKDSAVEPTSEKACVELRAWRFGVPHPLLQLIIEVEIHTFVMGVVNDADMMLFVWIDVG